MDAASIEVMTLPGSSTGFTIVVAVRLYRQLTTI
jgi:hypothetical protein